MVTGGAIDLHASEQILVINPAEAKTVRHIFALYRELGCVRRVKDEADRLGLRTKRRTTARGIERGGQPFARGHLYRLLSNPIYAGQIAHRRGDREAADTRVHVRAHAHETGTAYGDNRAYERAARRLRAP